MASFTAALNFISCDVKMPENEIQTLETKYIMKTFVSKWKKAQKNPLILFNIYHVEPVCSLFPFGFVMIPFLKKLFCS